MWIKGRKLLELPYNLTRRDIFRAVKNGTLVPWEPQDDVPSERVLRVFPTPELQEEWYWQLQHKIWRLNGAREWLSKSDAEHIEDYKRDPVLQHLKDLETFINALPRKREKYERIKKEYPSQIKDLEGKFSSNRVWKDLELGPEQQEILIEKLLNACYKEEEVESLLKVDSQKPSESLTKPIKQNSWSKKTREEIRRFAANLWDKEPKTTIEDMTGKIPRKIALKKNGEVYSIGTIKKWIKDLCPNRNPGRRPKE